MTQIQKNKEILAPKQDELILVVKRKDLFAKGTSWSGLKSVDFASYLTIINNKKEFLARSLMESDPTYKQIIPYLIFCHKDRYFLMQRAEKSTETRLSNKYSLGIGGHVRQEDLSSNSLFDWAKREFNEEVSYNDEYTIEPLGILNDDSNSVGQVHIGFVFLIKGTTDAIKVKSELKSGTLLALDECKHFFNQMESWSQFVFEFLMKQTGSI